MRDRRRTPAGGVQAEKQQRYVQLIAQGVNNSEACRLVGINRKTGNRWRYGRRAQNSAGALVIHAPVKINEVRPRSPRYLQPGTDSDRRSLVRRRAPVGSRSSWGARRQRSAARSVATAIRTAATDHTTPSTPPGAGRASRASGGSLSTRCWLRPSSCCWRNAGARREGRDELRVLFAGQPLRWLCKETIYQAIYDTAVTLTRPVRRRRRRRRLQRHATSWTADSDENDRRAAGRGRRSRSGRSLGGRSDPMGAGNRSAIGTLVERTDPVPGPAAIPRPASQTTDWGPPRGSQDSLESVPVGLKRTLTWDQGKGSCAAPADHRQDRHERVLLRRALAMAARQQREHERAAAGLLPEGTSVHTPADIATVTCEVNDRPRKTLGWQRPADLFYSAIATANA